MTVIFHDCKKLEESTSEFRRELYARVKEMQFAVLETVVAISM